VHARAFGFGDGNARSDMIARMRGRVLANVDVIQIVIPAGRDIGESGKIGGRPGCRTYNGGGAMDAARDFTAYADNPLVAGGDNASKRVDHVGFDAFDGRGVEIFETQRRRIRGQSFRDWPGLS
jgi:hypothetical protein